jgi:hypothetical protein
MIGTTAVLSMWHDIDPIGQSEYAEWHVLEHMPERVSIPGFVRGRRGVAIDPHQSPKYVTLYEAADVEVFRSAGYRERLDNPTAWTQRLQPMFQNFVRFANEVVVQRGFGDAAFVTTARFESVGPTSTAYTDVAERLGALVATLENLPQVASVALARSRDDITDYVTEEAQLRPANDGLDGVRHVAVVSVDTLTAAASGAVRERIRAAAADLGGVQLGHCSTFQVDYVIDAGQAARAPIATEAVERRKRA